MNAIRAILTLFVSMSPGLRAMLGVCSLVLALNTYTQTLWANVFSRVDAMAAFTIGYSYDISPLSLVNYVFPLDTMFTFITAYCAARLVLVVVRIIKAWIPTVS